MDEIQTVEIRSATPDDLEGIVTLLKRSSLPPDGLGEHLTTAIVACNAQGIIGSAALEMYGTEALLRSVAVDGPYQGQGLGHRLTNAALDMAREHGVATVYLLTETAGEFFPRFGFRPISRNDAPASVRQSVEFTTACCVSALVMMLPLPTGQASA